MVPFRDKSGVNLGVRPHGDTEISEGPDPSREPLIEETALPNEFPENGGGWYL